MWWSISAWGPAQILKPVKCAFRFIGRAERRLEKPECISPLIDRQWARATRSVGSSPALGFSSLRYSAIARVSQIETLPSVSRGTRKEGDRSEEHTSELQSLMRSSYAVFCLKKKTNIRHKT